MEVKKKAGRRTGASYLPFLGIIIVITFSLLALAHILSTRRKLRHASHAGRAISAKVSSTGLPLTTFNHSGNPGDPINMQICGTNGQIGAAFATAGWYRADEIDFITSVRISIDSILGRAYSTAPVSNLYLFGRKEDLAFERPGHTVRQRDHIRLWNTSRSGDNGRPIWIGSATKDVKVELSRTNHLPTHGIAPDLDGERDLVVSELAQTGFLIEDTTCPGFGEETHGFNGGGDPYFTDGQVAVLALAHIRTSPLATQVRSPLGARIVRYVAGFLRHRLPEAGLNRAASEQDHLKQAAQVG
jgi:LssY C-terminus